MLPHSSSATRALATAADAVVPGLLGKGCHGALALAALLLALWLACTVRFWLCQAV